MTIRIRKPAPGKKHAVLCNYRYCARLQRSKAVQHGLLDINSDPALLPHGIRLTSSYVLTDDDLAAVRHWLAAHGTFQQVDGYEALDNAYALLYSQLFRQWQQLMADGGLQRDFQPAWKKVQDLQDRFKSRLQALGAVKTVAKTAGASQADRAED